MLEKNTFIWIRKTLMGNKLMYQAYKLFFGTLTSQSRLRIINLLRKGPKNVSQIQYQLKLERTNLSHDLQRLKKCGFVNVEKKGKFRDYSLNEETIEPLMILIDKHMDNYCKKVVEKDIKKRGTKK